MKDSSSSNASSISMKDVKIPTLFDQAKAKKDLHKLQNKLQKFRMKLLNKISSLDGIQFVEQRQLESLITPQSRDVKRKMTGLYNKWKQIDMEMTAKTLTAFDLLDKVFTTMLTERANYEQLFDRARDCHMTNKEQKRRKEEAKRVYEEARRYKQDLDEEYPETPFKPPKGPKIEEVQVEKKEEDSSDEDSSSDEDESQSGESSKKAIKSAEDIMDHLFSPERPADKMD